MRRRRAPGSTVAGEEGSAVVEFVALMAVIVVPVLYLVLALADVQAAVLASEAGAREAVRILAEDPGAQDDARFQIDLSSADYGAPPPSGVTIDCSVCWGEGRDVVVSVETSVPLPLLPDWLSDRASVPIRATARSPLEEVAVDR
ncbi:hypothetical protein M3T53_08810 [Actinomyces sp. B33]|uniref:hypothetical protein n=1 Tax=Actinomyces sp. B33 TaxID=2942131 RepID=UPI00234197C9|nr:hypothetical protein [Actinomyces sp. B33]MDC4233802.1 hypothetical protein [Actinomyces sp. B33]